MKLTTSVEVKFWKSSSGKVPVVDSIMNLTEEMQYKVWWKIRRLEIRGAKLVHDGSHMKKLKGYCLYELRIKFYRILLIIINGTAWLLHMFIKKMRRTPEKEIKIALRRKAALEAQLAIT